MLAQAPTPPCARAEAGAPKPRRSRTRLLLDLFKIRLLLLVVITVATGYLVGARKNWALSPLLWTVLGAALAAAGAMALNQRLEIERDARMERTRTRPLPAGLLRPATATLLGIAAALLGVLALAGGVGLLPASLAAAVVLLYTLVYTPLKPRTSLNTLIGAVCGAIPPMIGWAAARGQLGPGAWLLFAILFLWQVPHFLSLAWLYRDDYARGGFRMLPADDPQGHVTGLAVVLHTAALTPLPVLAALYQLTGWFSASAGLLLTGWLVWEASRMAQLKTHASARRLFLSTLGFLPLIMGLLVVKPSNHRPRTAQLPPPFTAIVGFTSVADDRHP